MDFEWFRFFLALSHSTFLKPSHFASIRHGLALKQSRNSRWQQPMSSHNSYLAAFPDSRFWASQVGCALSKRKETQSKRGCPCDMWKKYTFFFPVNIFCFFFVPPFFLCFWWLVVRGSCGFFVGCLEVKRNQKMPPWTSTVRKPKMGCLIHIEEIGRCMLTYFFGGICYRRLLNFRLPS